ncbi:hypothetical protein ACQ4PT_054457 [Festuca glaucescens]
MQSAWEMSAAAQAGASTLGALEAAADFTEVAAPDLEQGMRFLKQKSWRRIFHMLSIRKRTHHRIHRKRGHMISKQKRTRRTFPLLALPIRLHPLFWYKPGRCLNPLMRVLKRPRVRKIPDFRSARNGRKSALELKLRKFGNRNSDTVVAPETGMEFDSLPEAFDFFNLYSWEVGFGIRYEASRRNKAKSKTMQEFCVGARGHRGTIRQTQWHVDVKP